jgi:hypothetical protein
MFYQSVAQISDWSVDNRLGYAHFGRRHGVRGYGPEGLAPPRRRPWAEAGDFKSQEPLIYALRLRMRRPEVTRGTQLRRGWVISEPSELVKSLQLVKSPVSAGCGISASEGRTPLPTSANDLALSSP